MVWRAFYCLSDTLALQNTNTADSATWWTLVKLKCSQRDICFPYYSLCGLTAANALLSTFSAMLFCQVVSKIEQLRRRRNRMFYYPPEMRNFCLNTICNIHFRFLVFGGSRSDATPLLLPALFIILWSALRTWTRKPPSPCPVLYSPTSCPRIILFIDNFRVIQTGLSIPSLLSQIHQPNHF